MSYINPYLLLPIASLINLVNIYVVGNSSPSPTTEESPHSQKVHDIALTIFKNEYQESSEFFKRIDSMLNNLPKTLGKKNIENLLKFRLKVTKNNDPSMQIFVQGHDKSDKGKYYLNIPPKYEKTIENSLKFLTIHELGHVLNNDVVNRAVFHAITVLTLSVFAFFLFNSNLVFGVLFIGFESLLTKITYSHYTESRADNFAIKHCKSIEELEAAKKFFEDLEKQRTSIFRKIYSLFSHPPQNQES